MVSSRRRFHGLVKYVVVVWSSSLATPLMAYSYSSQIYGLNAWGSNGYTWSNNAYQLTGVSALGSGSPSSLILQNAIGFAPANTFSVQGSSIVQSNMSGPIQLFTYGQWTYQTSSNPANFEASGFTADFSGLNLGMNVGATGGWPTGGNLPLMSNGLAGFDYPWGDDPNLTVAPFIFAASSIGTSGNNRSAGDGYNYTGGGSGTVDVQFSGSVFNVSASVSTPSGSGYVWEPAGGAIFVSSVGGNGGATTNTGKEDGSMNGGNVLNPVTVGLTSSTINLNNLNGSATSPYSGILAASIGGQAGACCVYAQNSDGSIDTSQSVLPQLDMTSQFYSGLLYQGTNQLKDNQGSMVANGYGSNGQASTVTVNLDDTTINGTGSYLHGVVASSVGGATQFNTDLPGSGNWAQAAGSATLTQSFFAEGQTGNDARPMTYPGASDDVDVTLTANAQLNLSGSNLVGVSATSTTAPYFILTNVITFSGDTPQMGDVSVSVDATSGIQVLDQAQTGLSMGVLAASAGSFSVNPFMQQGSGSEWTHGVGQAGAVTVTNAGTISVLGQHGIGVTALSVSNAGGLSQASGSSNSNGSTFNDGQSNDVTVTHTGSLTANGETAIGIYAGSSASGGMVLNLPTVDSSTQPKFVNGSAVSPTVRWIVDGGVVGQSAYGVATTYDLASQATVNGGDVIVTLSEGSTVSVGQGRDQTNVGFGLVAQSIGSGGGVTTGESAGIIGDASNGMSGGNGGTVTMSNYGSLTTKALSAVGILAQSIGGGGGAGASKTGLFSAVGGAGGSGGSGGAVSLGFYEGSSVNTEGSFAVGVIGHSIGGGGGYGGVSHAFGVVYAGGVGGSGGDGGAGGEIMLTSTGGQIATRGQHSQALVLQSVGGGGGVGGSTNTYSASVGVDISVATGGSGGSGGAGGSIQTVDANGISSPVLLNASTQSHDSATMLVQSIGGGGGNAGSAMAHAIAFGIPTVKEIPAISTSVALGGTGGSGGAGGNINFWHQGELVTRGINSYGILAQSIGAGGGNGGDGTAHAASYIAETKVSVAVGLGGSGGVGGDGGSSTLVVGPTSGVSAGTALSSILTLGNNAVGAMAQSVGGGGGSGGVGSGITIEARDELIGEFAGKLAAYGITIESISDKLVRFALKLDISTQLNSLTKMDHTFSVGSTSGASGVGGAVSLTLNGNVATIGASSHATMVQSVAGGGGRAISTGSRFDSLTFNSLVNVGGAGGINANGGSASLTNSGTIVTGRVFDLDNVTGTDWASFNAPMVMGSGSFGMFAQSVGGGGGEAGQIDPNGLAESSLIYDLATGNYGSAQVQSLGLTSQEISQVQSGEVKVAMSTSTTSTSGRHYQLSLNVGGTGGAAGAGMHTAWGGTGGPVQIEHSGQITTYGHHSIGVFGQSVGGGGGVGSAAIGPLYESADAQANGTVTTDMSMAVGGNWSGPQSLDGGDTSAINSSGQNMGSAGVVSYQSNNADSKITTHGYAAHGILLQSVGGGGGLAIEASTLGFENTGGWSINGGLMFASQESGLTNYNAYYLDLADALTGTVTIGNGYMRDALSTGNSSSPYAFSGKGFTGGTGGAINLGTSTSYAQGSVTTHGDGANAVFAQTIGGGGGIAVIGCTNSAPANLAQYASPCWGNTVVSGNSGQPAAYTSGYGSSGADVFVNPNNVLFTVSDNSGAVIEGAQSWTNGVNVYSSQTITTYGARSMGVMTQSVASAGGYLNVSDNLISLVAAPFESAAWWQTAATTVGLNDSTVTTYGDGAWGLFSQSVAGGGGFAGDSSQNLTYTFPYMDAAFDPMQTVIPVSSMQPSTYTNAATTVTLTSSLITTSGTNAHGIVLQNLGGAGGAFLTNGSLYLGQTCVNNCTSLGIYVPPLRQGGQISLTLDNSQVVVTGQQSRGVVLQSAGPYGVNGPSAGTYAPIMVELNGNSVISSAQATALVILGGSYIQASPNTVTVNSGQITSGVYQSQYLQAVDNTDNPDNGWAIYAPVGYTNVTNGADGTIVGNIYLGGLSETQGDITNYGKWEGSSVVVADNSLHNYGSMYPSGQGVSGPSSIVGSLKHYDGGVLYLDISSQQPGVVQNDTVSVTGQALLVGEFVAETPYLLPLSGVQIFSAGTLAFYGSARDSLVFDWTASARGNAVDLSVAADFRPDGVALTGNEGAMADYLQRLWSDSSAGQASLFGYINEEFAQGDGSGYVAGLNQITGQVLNSQAIEMKTAFATSLSDSLSCPMVTDQGLKLNQTDCAWARLTGSIAEQSANSSNSGYHVTAGGIRLGAQKALRDQWATGFSLGYANNYLTSTGLTSNGSFFDASLSAQKEFNNWSFGGSLGLAYGWFDNNRSLNLGANGAAAAMSDLYTSSSDMMMVGLRLRAAYEYEQKDYFIKPYVDLDLMYSHTSGYTESGSGALAIKANASNQFNVAISPMVEFGTDLVTDGKRRIKAYASVGATFVPNNSVATQMAFANGVPGSGTYDVITDGPSVLGRLNLGIQAFEANDLEVRAQYGFQVGDGYWSQSLSASLVYRF